MTDQLPPIHLHEGRLNGIFELPPADMPYIHYQGRVMLVLLADATKISIGDTKDGDTKASWVFKAVDAAVVREESMRDHLASTLYLADDEAPTPNFVSNVPLVPEGPQYEGRYDEKGTFLSIEPTPTEELDGFEAGDEEEEVEVPEPPRESLFKQKAPEGSRLPPPSEPPVTGTEMYGRPVTYKDPVLAGFMRDD